MDTGCVRLWGPSIQNWFLSLDKALWTSSPSLVCSRPGTVYRSVPWGRRTMRVVSTTWAFSLSERDYLGTLRRLSRGKLNIIFICLQTFNLDVWVRVLCTPILYFYCWFLVWLMYSALKAVSSDNTKAVCTIKDNYARVLRYTSCILYYAFVYTCVQSLLLYGCFAYPVLKGRCLKL